MFANNTSTSASRWRIFPNALDFIVMAVWVFISQYIVLNICTACGLQLPDLEAVGSRDADISLSASLDTARALTLFYAPSMVLAIIGILLYRRLRGGRGPVAGFSGAGFNPSLILGGFVWILATEIVIEPLLALMPDTPDTVGRGFFALLVTVVLAPVFEEFLCRGIILESFRRKYGTVVAWFASSLFFAVIHGQPTSAVNAFIIGSILGCICIRSRSIFSTIALHALNNGLALTMITIGLSDTTFSELIPDRRIYFAIYAAAALICVIGAITLFRTLSTAGRVEKSAE